MYHGWPHRAGSFPAARTLQDFFPLDTGVTVIRRWVGRSDSRWQNALCPSLVSWKQNSHTPNYRALCTLSLSLPFPGSKCGLLSHCHLYHLVTGWPGHVASLLRTSLFATLRLMITPTLRSWEACVAGVWPKLSTVVIVIVTVAHSYLQHRLQQALLPPSYRLGNRLIERASCGLVRAAVRTWTLVYLAPQIFLLHHDYTPDRNIALFLEGVPQVPRILPEKFNPPNTITYFTI